MSCNPTCLKQSSCYNCDKTVPFKEVPYERTHYAKRFGPANILLVRTQLLPLNYVIPIDLRKPSTI